LLAFTFASLTYRTAAVLDAVDDDPIDQLTAKTTKPETFELANHEPHT
jgi:hypothetical protein